MKKVAFIFTIIAGSAIAAFAQGAAADQSAIKGTPAYAEVLLRKTELQADLEAYAPDYTEANPKMIELRAELASIDKSLDRILATKTAQIGRLTDALGRMMVKKAALEADLVRLSRTYSKEHPDVKRAQRRVDLFESSITDILKQ
ncbi:MAG: hypothetical protein JO314_07220 [Acidobacteria bacterium]|nr:hypothetical protein [Acidobacteriota bacterium]